MKWIKRHKILFFIAVFLFTLLLGGFLYIWSLLGLIQYDDPNDASLNSEFYDAEADEYEVDDSNIVLDDLVTFDPPIDPDSSEQAAETLIPVPTEESASVKPGGDVMEPSPGHTSDGTAMESSTPEENKVPANDDISKSDTKTQIAFDLITPVELKKTEKGIINVLLLGTDERTNEFSNNARSDCMILASIDTKNETIKLVSLERAIGVPILSGKYKGQYDWMTHTFRYGGANLVMETVEHCFGVEVDHYFRVNFNIFTQVIDSIGGIDIELTKAEAEHISNLTKETYSEGMNHFDGKTALKYARLRKLDSDWVRVTRQRQVIQACIVQVRDNLSLIDASEIAKQILPMIKTNYSKGELAKLLLMAPSFLNYSIDQMTIPAKGTYGSMTGMGGRTLYSVNFEENSKILQEFLY